MKSIEVSADVFAKIWVLRRPGEDTENQILMRVLLENEHTCAKGSVDRPSTTVGHTETRFGVHFPEGFRIFRTYKGSTFQAEVIGGQWQIAGLPDRFSSLNELSRAIGTKTENAWRNWFFLNENGERQSVSELRASDSVSRRAVTSATKSLSDKNKVRWCDDVFHALSSLGGEAHLSDIYKVVTSARKAANRSLPENTEAVIRKELEMRSSDSEAFDSNRGEDWFEIRGGKGSGVWGLRNKSN